MIRERENPNSTNPFFANKARSPDKSNRVGFSGKNELRRTPEPLLRLERDSSDSKEREIDSGRDLE